MQKQKYQIGRDDNDNEEDEENFIKYLQMLEKQRSQYLRHKHTILGKDRSKHNSNLSVDAHEISVQKSKNERRHRGGILPSMQTIQTKFDQDEAILDFTDR